VFEILRRRKAQGFLQLSAQESTKIIAGGRSAATRTWLCLRDT